MSSLEGRTVEERLGFDATSLSPTGKGMSRFQAGFLDALADLGVCRDVVVFVPRELDAGLLKQVHGWRYAPVRVSPMLWWEQIGLPTEARRQGVDFIISGSERAPWWGPRRAVYIYEHPIHRIRRQAQLGVPPRQALINRMTLRLLSVSLRKADHVFAASKSTASDLSPICSAQVVYSAVGTDFTPDEERGRAKREALRLPDGYLLHLASDDPRDDTGTVLRAVAVLRARGLETSLVLAGPATDSLPGLHALAESLGVGSQIEWLGFQDHDDLIDLYRGAIAYVDSSLYEGFGLQILEALSCGTPTIAADTTSVPEVLGDAGMLVPPGQPKALADACQELLSDPALRSELRTRAKDQSSRFSWHKTVTEVLSKSGLLT